jgi:hypothetical protein
MIATLASDPPRPNVLFQTYIAGQRLTALLDRHLETSGVTSNPFGLLSALGIWGPIVARRGFGDMWVSNFGGFAIWRLRAG